MSSPNTIVKHRLGKDAIFSWKKPPHPVPLAKSFGTRTPTGHQRRNGKDLFRTTMKRKSRTQKNKA